MAFRARSHAGRRASRRRLFTTLGDAAVDHDWSRSLLLLGLVAVALAALQILT